MPSTAEGKVHIARDKLGTVYQVEHLQQPFIDEEAPRAPASDLVEKYLQKLAATYGIEEHMLPDSRASAPDGYTGIGLRWAQEKAAMEVITVSYQQFYQGLPVWDAGFSATILQGPLRVVASRSSIHTSVSLIPGGDPDVGVRFTPESIKPPILTRLLGLDERDISSINNARRLIYRYDPEQRVAPDAQVKVDGAVYYLGLRLESIPGSFVPNAHYTVVEVLFTLTLQGRSLHWRAFIEDRTGAVLYVRAFTTCAAAMVFRADPLTLVGIGAPQPTDNAALLNPLRTRVELLGLRSREFQELTGEFVRVVDVEEPTTSPVVQRNPPGDFFYSAHAREFAAVNAYHHCDGIFRYIAGMGFDLEKYFDGTTFPVSVDGCALDDDLNACADGNASGDGLDRFRFGQGRASKPAVGIAADLRVVLHEFGHAILWDHLHSGEFGFAHSPGDSLAAILLDPESALRNDPNLRCETFPWTLGRNHGLFVEAGWGWGGANDLGSYASEQILSTTLFRFYRAVGGDSDEVSQRKLAARQCAFLIIKAVGTLDQYTQTRHVMVFANALKIADAGTEDFEGYRGGSFNKVLRWAFEKQGLYQPPGAPDPVIGPGAPPEVDVYFDDGRAGEYAFQPVFWECKDIWNRLTVSSDGGLAVHEVPVEGRTNFAYCLVKNRGTRHADNVSIRAYTAGGKVRPSWPDDWTRMESEEISVKGGIAPGADVLVGPFRWVPQSTNRESILMEVNADGDFSNLNEKSLLPCAKGPTPDWTIIPFDNNLALRTTEVITGSADNLSLF